jgi:hypothetical protein
MRIKLGVVMAVAVALAAASGDAALAVPTDSDTFEINGAVNVQPSIWLTLPSTGTYTFNSSCTVYEEVDALSPIPQTTFYGCSAGGSGSYTNVVCGNGTWQGTMSVSEAGEAQAATATYTVVFSAWHGALTGTFNDEGKSGTLTGSLLVLPAAGADCTISFASWFSISGTITATY